MLILLSNSIFDVLNFKNQFIIDEKINNNKEYFYLINVDRKYTYSDILSRLYALKLCLLLHISKM